MGMLTKGALAGGAAALASEDAEAGWVMNNLGKPVLEAWHGGLKGIPKFQDKYLGSGEGAHVYTYGHYMADQRRTAKRYRDDRQREYDDEANQGFFESDLLDYYRSNPNSYIQITYGDAPPLTMRFDDYQQIVLEAAEKFGKNSAAAQDYITRKALRSADERREWIDRMSAGVYEEEDIQGVSGKAIGQQYWIEDSINALAYEVGVTPVEMQRSLRYDLEDSLPLGVEFADLSLRGLNNLYEPLIMERLNLVKSRMAKEAVQRRLVLAVNDGSAVKKPSWMVSGEKPTFEAKVPDEIAKKYGSDVLFDWDKMIDNPNRKKAGLYRLHSDVQYDDLLHWEQQIADHPEAIKMAVSSAAKDILDMGVASGRITPDDLTRRVPVHNEEGYAMTGLELLDRVAKGNFPPQFSAADFATQFSQSVSPDAFMNGAELSALLKSKGIKGMMYQDGWTRHKNGVEPYYNYVIYDEDLIDIMERGMSTVPMNMLLATGAGVGLGAPVLNKEIAERFPMPQPEATMMERISSNPNVRAAMAHPITQYMNLQMSNAEWPERLMSGIVEGIYNLANEVKPKQAGQEFAQRLKTPYDQTLNELGDYVLEETNSPALATGAYLGGMVLSPSNIVGP